MENIYISSYRWLNYGLCSLTKKVCENHELVCDFLDTYPEIAKDYNANIKFTKYHYYDILLLAEYCWLNNNGGVK